MTPRIADRATLLVPGSLLYKPEQPLNNRISLSSADNNRKRPVPVPVLALSPSLLFREQKEKPRMTTDNPLPTPPSASASGIPTPASEAAAASGSQATDPVVAAAPPPSGQQTAPAAQQQQQQQQQQAPPSPAEAIEVLLQQILASNDEAALAGTLLNSLGSSDTRESILSSLTPAGADPLDSLDAARHTIGSLCILCVLVSSLLLSPPFPRYCLSLLCWNAVCAEPRFTFHGFVFLLASFPFCRYLALAG